MTEKLPGTAYDYQRSRYKIQHIYDDQEQQPRRFNVYRKRSRLEQKPRVNYMTYQAPI